MRGSDNSPSIIAPISSRRVSATRSWWYFRPRCSGILLLLLLCPVRAQKWNKRLRISECAPGFLAVRLVTRNRDIRKKQRASEDALCPGHLRLGPVSGTRAAGSLSTLCRSPLCGVKLAGDERSDFWIRFCLAGLTAIREQRRLCVRTRVQHSNFWGRLLVPGFRQANAPQNSQHQRGNVNS